MMTTQEKIDALNVLKRIETRCDNMRLAFKNQGSTYQHDMNTLLSQLSLIRNFIKLQSVNA